MNKTTTCRKLSLNFPEKKALSKKHHFENKKAARMKRHEMVTRNLLFEKSKATIDDAPREKPPRVDLITLNMPV
jgi:hypothetical protein